jgi:hypothetical protein
LIHGLAIGHVGLCARRPGAGAPGRPVKSEDGCGNGMARTAEQNAYRSFAGPANPPPPPAIPIATGRPFRAVAPAH